MDSHISEAGSLSPIQPRPVRPVVLVVDDDPLLLIVIRLVLEDDGYLVLTAQDGDEALELARTFPGVIHCSVTDIRMPKTDGFALREHLMKERPGIKVLLMSAEVHLSNEGCFLRKPFVMNVLKERVRQLMTSPAI